MTIEDLFELLRADVDSLPFAPSDQSICPVCSQFGGGHFPWCSRAFHAGGGAQ